VPDVPGSRRSEQEEAMGKKPDEDQEVDEATEEELEELNEDLGDPEDDE
jgi:hypothetical protein